MQAVPFLLFGCTVASLCCLVHGTAESVAVQVGESVEYSLQEEQVNFIYLFNRTEEGQSPALRLVVTSENASLRHPLLITARQSQGISSWTIPYVESGFTFSTVERTLCPLLNNDPDGPPQLRVVVEVSTTSPIPVNLTLASSFVENFYHRLNVAASVTATPSSPAYLLFEHTNETTRVRVRFSSADDTSDVCAIASIQKSYCPVVELLDNPDHRGTFQTMRSQAAINIELVSVDEDVDIITDRQQTQFSFFYIVVSVFPSNDTCQSMGVAATSQLVTLDVADNFNPVPFSGTDLTKNVNITIETSFPANGYGVGIIVPTIIYFMFYFIALVWILFADWLRHMNHPLEDLIEERKVRLAEYYGTLEGEDTNIDLENAESALLEPDPESGLTAAASEYARQTSLLNPEAEEFSRQMSLLNPEVSRSSHPEIDTPGTSCERTDGDISNHPRQVASSPTHNPPTASPGDQTNSSPAHLIASSPTHLASPREETDRGYSLKNPFSYLRSGDSQRKPSALSVLFGSQYNNAISQMTTPSPHYPQYLHSSAVTSPHRHSHHSIHSRKTSSDSQPHSTDPFQSALPSSSHTRTRNHTHHGGSSSVASPVAPHVTRSTSLGSPRKSVSSNHAPRPRLQPSISLTSPVVHQVTLSMHSRGRVPTEGVESSDGIDEKLENELRVRPRALSYSRAVDAGLDMEGVGLGEVGVATLAIGEEEEEKYRHDKAPFPVNLLMSELSEFDETAQMQKQYNLLSWYLVAVIIFYAIPAYQLVITYQQLLTLSGNQDLCYYNNLCSHSWRISNHLTLTAFNNICSNIGYFVLGGLFILIAYRRRRVYRAVEELVNNPFITHRDERVGVPQHFGIYYAIGLALMAEGFMSVAYHVCPGKTNYQFDTTFMFVLAGLGIFKLLESRNPDKRPGFHKLLVLVAAMIVMVVVGVLASSLAFYILFFFVHVLTTFVVTVEYYYRWEIKLRCLPAFLRYITSKPYCPPKQIPKFVLCILANLLNWGFAIFAVAVQPADFGTFFLIILLTNFILLLCYYIITKCVYKERPSFRPIFFLILSLINWALSIYFYTQAVTNWLESPAVSRDGNSECLALFYDSHDMWHFMSAFALFFSYLMLMTLDDDTEGTPRTKLRVF